MPLHRTIGISLALMMISAGTNAQTATKSTAQDPVHAVKPDEAHSRTARAHSRHAASRRMRAARRVVHHYAPPHHPVMLASAELSAPYIGESQAGVHGQTGMAAWYDLTGRRTASGERFDRTVMTAAHRTLPLFSYAKVTNLENGRSVVVEINDRGPFRTGLIIDLSESAAETLQMIGAGLAHVSVEPLGDAPPAAEPQLAADDTLAAPAIKPMLVAYHPDPPVAAKEPASDPQLQQDAWLQQRMTGSQ